MAKRKSKAKPEPRRSVSLVQQARRVAQLEARRRGLRRQLRDVDDLVRRERKFLRDMADTNVYEAGDLP
jgi:hypothetical protein